LRVGAVAGKRSRLPNAGSRWRRQIGSAARRSGIPVIGNACARRRGRLHVQRSGRPAVGVHGKRGLASRRLGRCHTGSRRWGGGASCRHAARCRVIVAAPAQASTALTVLTPVQGQSDQDPTSQAKTAIFAHDLPHFPERLALRRAVNGPCAPEYLRPLALPSFAARPDISGELYAGQERLQQR
jgi:hypothetical protein